MFKIPFFEKKNHNKNDSTCFILCGVFYCLFTSRAISLSFRFQVVLTISTGNSKTKNIFYDSLLNTDTMACPLGVRINRAQVNKQHTFINSK